MSLIRVFAAVTMMVVCVSCGDSNSPNGAGANDGVLVVRGSTTATASAASRAAAPGVMAALLDVSPSLFEVGLLEMRLSESTACTAPYVVIFARTRPGVVDLVASPEIARATGLTAGSYPCVLLRLSDQLRYRAVRSEGSCTAGLDYRQDFYRFENELVAFRNPDGAVVAARGTDVAPVEDFVWTYLSTSPSAVTARGYSPSQVNALSTPLVVPGTTTFFVDATNAVTTSRPTCEIQFGRAGFR